MQDVGKLPLSTIKKQAMSSQGFLFGMAPVYLTDSPIVVSDYAVRRRATLHRRHGRLSGVHKVMSQSIVVCCIGSIQDSRADHGVDLLPEDTP